MEPGGSMPHSQGLSDNSSQENQQWFEDRLAGQTSTHY